MKWYKRDPDAALTGFRGLTHDEKSAYGTIIDLSYSRNGDLPDDDRLLCVHIECRPQWWRRVKALLIAKGKLRVIDGKLVANRVETTLKEAANFSETQSKRAKNGWVSRKNNNGANGHSMPPDNANTTTTTYTEKKEDPSSLPRKRAKPKTTIPENWHPELVGEREFDQFCDHARANGRLCVNWEAAWRMWNRNAPRFSNRSQTSGMARPGYKDKRQQELEDVKAALDASIARANDAGESGADDQTTNGVLPFPQRA